MMNLDKFESLLNCQSVEELHATTAGIVRQMGYEHFLYGVRVNVSLTRPYQFIFSGYPKQWWEHYRESGYQNLDPIVRHSAKRVIPLMWDDRVFSLPEATTIMNEARDYGLASGISFPIHGLNCEFGLLSLAGDRDMKRAKKDIMESLGRAQLLANYLHEAVHRIVLSKEAFPLQKAQLTEREKECLLWAAEGKTSWEISNIIHTSERTVVFHLQNASKKMGVSTRQHAVARALSMGLIAP